MSILVQPWEEFQRKVIYKEWNRNALEKKEQVEDLAICMCCSCELELSSH